MLLSLASDLYVGHSTRVVSMSQIQQLTLFVRLSTWIRWLFSRCLMKHCHFDYISLRTLYCIILFECKVRTISRRAFSLQKPGAWPSSKEKLSFNRKKTSQDQAHTVHPPAHWITLNLSVHFELRVTACENAFMKIWSSQNYRCCKLLYVHIYELFHMECLRWAHTDVYADAAQSSSPESNASLCNMLAAAKIPALLLIFTAKSHDSREADSWKGSGGCRLTVKVLEKKKNVGWRQREQQRRKKSGPF